MQWKNRFLGHTHPQINGVYANKWHMYIDCVNDRERGRRSQVANRFGLCLMFFSLSLSFIVKIGSDVDSRVIVVRPLRQYQSIINERQIKWEREPSWRSCFTSFGNWNIQRTYTWILNAINVVLFAAYILCIHMSSCAAIGRELGGQPILHAVKSRPICIFV